MTTATGFGKNAAATRKPHGEDDNKHDGQPVKFREPVGFTSGGVPYRQGTLLADFGKRRTLPARRRRRTDGRSQTCGRDWGHAGLFPLPAGPAFLPLGTMYTSIAGASYMRRMGSSRGSCFVCTAGHFRAWEIAVFPRGGLKAKLCKPSTFWALTVVAGISTTRRNRRRRPRDARATVPSFHRSFDHMRAVKLSETKTGWRLPAADAVRQTMAHAGRTPGRPFPRGDREPTEGMPACWPGSVRPKLTDPAARQCADLVGKKRLRNGKSPK